jgi:IS605 OrfB family transposase
LTLACKLQPTAEEAQPIDATMQTFADACAYIHATLPERIVNVMRMQAMLYYDVRGKFGLSSNLTQQAFRRVSGNRKTARARGESVKAFGATSIQYDQRIFSFNERDWSVSFTLLHGRAHFRLILGNYQRGKLKGHKPTSAQLCKRRDGSYAVHIPVKVPVPDPTPRQDVIGVDLGRTDIAHTSEGQRWEGGDIRRCRDRFSRIRAALQRKASKGTRSTRRRCRQLLQRLSGREKRFQRHTNHVISKTLVETARASQSGLALEDLTGIRERINTKPRRKDERRRSNSWAFFQLRQYVTYKAALAGVVVILVPPAYTSQMCHCCWHIGSRTAKRFVCEHCGYSGDADYNGAQNIKTLGVSLLSDPRGPYLQSRWPQVQGSQKPQQLHLWVA